MHARQAQQAQLGTCQSNQLSPTSLVHGLDSIKGAVSGSLTFEAQQACIKSNETAICRVSILRRDLTQVQVISDAYLIVVTGAGRSTERQ